MTNLDDFDRSLGAFLADGPNTAPEAPVIAAMAHARTTPRRPDPLRAFRADPMAPRRTGLVGARPGLVLAVLAIAVGAVGVAVVGSRRPGDAVLPVPSANDLSSPSSVPSAVGSPTPSSGPSDGPAVRQVALTVAAGNPFTLTILDPAGDVGDATSGNPGDGASVAFDTVQIATDPADPAGLVITWTGGPCETGAVLSVDAAARRIAIQRQNCAGDAVAYDRVVRLVLAAPTTASEWTGTIGLKPASGDSPSPADPSAVHLDLIGQCCNTPTIDVVDRSGHLTGVASLPSDGLSADVLTATNDDPRTVRVVWPGAPCDRVHRLLVAADFGLTVDRPICHGDSVRTMRGVILTYDVDVPADQVDLALFDGRPESGLPTWTASAPDGAGDPYDITAADPGSVVDSFEGYFDPQLAVDGGGIHGIRIVRSTGAGLTLIWLAPACATAPSLEIDPSGGIWKLTNASCTPLEPLVVRMVGVTLKAPLSGDAVPSVELVTAAP